MSRKKKKESARKAGRPRKNSKVAVNRGEGVRRKSRHTHSH